VDGNGAIIISNKVITGEITLDGLIADGYTIEILPGELIVLDRATPTPTPTATPTPERVVDAPKTGDINLIMITLSTTAILSEIFILTKKKKKFRRC